MASRKQRPAELRGRHNSYRVKKPGDHGTRHKAPPTIRLANPVNPQLAASSMINNKLSGIAS